MNGSRPLLGDDMTATRDGTCRADLRQAGAVKRNQAEGGRHLYLREGSRLQERERDKTRANATQASLRERTFKRGRQIADAIALRRIVEAVAARRAEKERLEVATMDTRQASAVRNRFKR